jgi:uncharacterized membrane protein YphA (DoxX/SURF4 family)
VYAEQSTLDLVGRLLIVQFFLLTGLANLRPASIKDHIERMARFGVPLPALAFWLGMVLNFAGCALLIADWHAAWGVYALMLFTAAATAIFHRFWRMSDPFKRNFSRITLLGNAGIVGGLLLLIERVR